MQHTDKYDDVSATTNMEGLNTKAIEIRDNEVEINWQSDYLQAIWWSLAQTVHRYGDIHNHYAQKIRKRKETLRE